MPESPESEDSFADLYGKLPDGAGRRDAAPAPGSRRAAREAAAREAAAREAAAHESSAPQSRDSAPAPEEPEPTPAPRATGEQAAPVSASASQGRERDATMDDIFAADPGLQEQRRHKRGRRLGCTVVLVLILLLVGGIAAGGFWVWNTYEDQIREVMGWQEPKDYEDGLAQGEAVITIEEGDNPSDISQTLYDAGVTKTSDAFYSYLVDEGIATTFYPGVYQLQLKMTSAAALAAIEDPANKLENTAQIPEGYTVEQTIARISEDIGIPLEDLQAAVADPSAYGVDADSLEGWLFPATYTFEPDVTAEQIVQTLVDRAVRSLDDAGVPEDEREEILTIASIIQREARYEEDFYKVSRVIQNRLDPDNQETFGLLQMDSTAQYGYGEMHDGTASSSAEALADDNPWNTYVYAGLPVGPIANPGDVAIDAAMHPADGDWLYFVTVNLDTGETVFTDNLADHEAAIEQWRAWCTENPDSGC